MRVFLVLDETHFHQPAFVEEFLRTTAHDVIGCALVVDVPAKHNIEAYFRRNWRRLTLREMAVLGSRKYYRALLDRIVPGRRGGPVYSVRSALHRHAVPFFTVAGDINSDENIERIRSAEADVIVSSNSLIFGERLLNVPRVCCLNRHSALLPAYGGLLPVFQAYGAGESHVGVSVHTMERRIDNGVVLAQAPVKIRPADTVDDLYARCFGASARVLNEALAKVERGDFSSCTEDAVASYFTFPTADHWVDFRRRGGRMV